MPTTTYRPGDAVTVRDCHGKSWPATYRGRSGPGDDTGCIIEINRATDRDSRTRAELRNIIKA